MYKITSHNLLAPAVRDMLIEAPLIARNRKAGQFVMVRIGELSERIPLTIAGADIDAGTIRLIYQEVGKTTMEMGQLKIGDTLADVVGPLGKPTHLEKLGTVVCVGGGTGVAVMHPITKGLKDVGNRVIAVIGARTKDLLILEDEMKAASTELHVCTDDGSYGHHGFVTEVLKDILKKEDVKLVVAIGPVPMMKFACQVTDEYKVKTIVSLNSIMVDGTGMCGCCRVSVGGKTRFACVEGPEFDGHQVDFGELMQRLDAYKEEEAAAYDKFKCDCQAG